jgi:hypothetical protein
MRLLLDTSKLIFTNPITTLGVKFSRIIAAVAGR